MDTKTASEMSLQGWIAALIHTGYVKVHECVIYSGASIVVYQNETNGNATVCVVFPGDQGWTVLYPQCGFWGGLYHHYVAGGDSKWTEKTPKEMEQAVLSGLEQPQKADDTTGDKLST